MYFLCKSYYNGAHTLQSNNSDVLNERYFNLLLWRLRTGMMFIFQEIHAEKVIIEIDCLELVNLWKTRTSNNAAILPVLMQI